MKIISFWSPKGGVGKSTHTINAARQHAEKGERVGVIDADFPQYSVKKYRDYTGDKSFGLHIFDGGSLIKFVEKFGRDYDRLFLDLPPRATQTARELVAIDGVKIIVPVISGDLDQFALMELLELQNEAHKHGVTDFKLFTFLNRAQSAVGAKTNAETRQLLDDVALPRLKSELVSRTAYGKIASGKNLKELDRKAYNEFCALIDEIEKL
ncbi:AAA family ATPase [Salmonella enterica]|nr:AAA family ATPase [Salmonella enterica]